MKEKEDEMVTMKKEDGESVYNEDGQDVLID